MSAAAFAWAVVATLAAVASQRARAEEARRRRAAEKELRGVLLDAALSGGLRVEMTETGYALTYGAGGAGGEP